VLKDGRTDDHQINGNEIGKQTQTTPWSMGR